MAKPRRHRGNIPADATTFVGRRRELQELRRRISGSRLVTLVGPGGVGKTRLAMRIAGDLERGFADGAWWVDLAETLESSAIDTAVMAALDLRDQAQRQPRDIVLGYLRERRLLLVLDNCEHVIDAAARLVNDVLRAAPDVRVIATSREPLQSAGEHLALVTPFELPAPDQTSAAAAIRNEAVALFVARATAASGAFELTPGNQQAVVRICRRLDGLPLAIELAAVRTRVITVEQIDDRLSDRFRLLTRGDRAALPRHQTLRTAIDWSHDLLSERERVLLRRLGVFPGAFTVSDAEAVCELDPTTDAGTMDLLGGLVEKSLLSKSDVDDVAVYRLHETMREYAGEKLAEAGEIVAVDGSFIGYFVRRCAAARDAGDERSIAFLKWVELEIDNIRAALQKCLATGDFTRGLELASSMGYFWVTRGISEAVGWFDVLMAKATDAKVPIPPRAYLFRGWFSMIQIDPAKARPWLQKGISAARAMGGAVDLVELLSFAATAEDMAGEFDAAARLLDDARNLSDTNDVYDARIALHQAAGIHAYMQGDLSTAQVESGAGEMLSRQAGDLYYLEQMQMNLGLQDIAAGNRPAARVKFLDALRVARSIDNRLAQYYLVRLLGWHAAQSGDSRRAALLAGAASALGEASGAMMMGPHEARLRADLDAAAEELGQAKFDAQYAAGRRLDRESAIRLALGEEAPRTEPRSQAALSPLARREIEVARLIAEGMSNKEIAGRLVIAERTVTTHVQNILNKLGFDSRSQVASWVTASEDRPERD